MLDRFIRCRQQPDLGPIPVLMVCAVIFIGGCGGRWDPTLFFTDKAMFESMIVSRVWTNRTEHGFQLRQIWSRCVAPRPARRIGAWLLMR